MEALGKVRREVGRIRFEQLKRGLRMIIRRLRRLSSMKIWTMLLLGSGDWGFGAFSFPKFSGVPMSVILF